MLDHVSLLSTEQEELQALLDKATNPLNASTEKALQDMDRGGKLLVHLTKSAQSISMNMSQFETRYHQDLALLMQIIAGIERKAPAEEVKEMLERLEKSAESI